MSTESGRPGAEWVMLSGLLAMLGGCVDAGGMADDARAGAGGVSGVMNPATGGAKLPADQCREHQKESSNAVAELTELHGACDVDEDCTLTPVGRHCYEACPRAVNSSELASFESALDSVLAESCAERPAQCEAAGQAPSCWTLEPRCRDGQCQARCPKDEVLDELEQAGRIMRSGLSCSGTPCAALPAPADPRLHYAKQCCTDGGTCGVTGLPIVDATCFERDHAGEQDVGCPDEILFLHVDRGVDVAVFDSLPGCCRPDGQCGLDTGRTLGAGCVERSALAAALQDACEPGRREFGQSLVAIACTP